MLEELLKREEIINELNFLSSNLEKLRIEKIKLDELMEEFSNLEKEDKEILFKINEFILKSNKNEEFYFNVGANIFIQTNLTGLEEIIKRRQEKIKLKEKNIGEKIHNLENELIEIEKKLNELK